jgi:hypothetical protein
VTRDAAMLLALTLTFAAWLMVHAALLVRVTRTKNAALGLRALAWVPVLTPIVGWRVGAKAWSVVWLVVGLAYAVLRGVG